MLQIPIPLKTLSDPKYVINIIRNSPKIVIYIRWNPILLVG